MWYILKVIIISIVLIGCNTSPLSLFVGSTSFSQLSLPTSDHGYSNLRTRVISSYDEYKAFLRGVDSQKNWDTKVTFGIKIAKQHINFKKDNLLIYRHPASVTPIALATKTLSSQETNATVFIYKDESKSKKKAKYHAFFYKVSKKIKNITFKNKNKAVTIKNSRKSSVVPKECAAWFDGCNHCIRSSEGRIICTKRYCKAKGKFRCVKWN
ncbi:MAG: hypothetical protein HF962_05060 [Sulfurovum sp.]|nr:hypothetical protein [Sulfurovum sp.]